MFKADIIISLKPILKEKNFKKIRNYWYIAKNGMTFYLNIQGSCYCSDDFYVNLGVVFSPFDGRIPPIYTWDRRRRVFVEGKQINFDIEDVIAVLEFFLDLFPTVREAEIFVNSQKNKYERIIISNRYMLA